MRASSLVLLLVVALGAGANIIIGQSIDEQRRKALATAPAAPPPEVAVPTVLLGAFRGLVVDYLWLRALRLEEDGKFYEAKDLAEWIATLEPHLEQVWSFQAHGLAYNLSAASDEPGERYKWIKAGIDLLREKGIALNPHAPELYFMLSRIYSDKIGGPFDDYQLFLKKSLAIELVRAFGPLGEDAELEALAKAPAELDPAAKALLAQLEAAGLDLKATDDAWDEALAKAKKAREVAKHGDIETLKRLRAFYRAKWARKLGLDPAKCLALEERYGPLEWRGCDALSLYWAVEGARAAEKLGPRRKAKEARRLERLAIDSVKHAVRRGRLILEPGGEVFFAPEPKLVGRLVALYDEAIERARAAEKAGEVIADDEDADASDDGHHHEKPQENLTAGLYAHSLEEARKDFLVEGVAVLARYGKEAEARRLFTVLKRDHPAAAQGSYDEFVNTILSLEVQGEYGNQVTTYQILLGTWTRAWLSLARGDDEQALGRIALADRVHREWQKKVSKAIAEGDLKAQERLGTVKIKEVKDQSLRDALARLTNPTLRKRLEERAAALLKSGEEEK